MNCAGVSWRKAIINIFAIHVRGERRIWLDSYLVVIGI